MNIMGINKARVFLFTIFFSVILVLNFITLINLIPEYNSFLLGGIILFFLSMAVILEKITVDTVLRNVDDKKKSSIHVYSSTKALTIVGIILISFLVISVLLAIFNYLEEKSINWLIILFGSSLSLLNVSFLVDTGRLVFINNEYIIYHQGLYKKVIAYQHTDASVICIVEDGNKRQKKAVLKCKNVEVKNKFIEDFMKNGLKEERE